MDGPRPADICSIIATVRTSGEKDGGKERGKKRNRNMGGCNYGEEFFHSTRPSARDEKQEKGRKREPFPLRFTPSAPALGRSKTEE